MVEVAKGSRGRFNCVQACGVNRRATGSSEFQRSGPACGKPPFVDIRQPFEDTSAADPGRPGQAHEPAAL
ncbi:MAG: hypothetical protein C0505_19090 [Leptothrix sp. (in: Bacteria)]|nr:hypothetical protein [Leptothrix sp. (in: b-proteobacteria)]